MSLCILGSLPTGSGQVTQGTGCAVYNSDTCYLTYSVSNIIVQNCGSYNVYYLKKTAASAAYCMTKV